jgi:arylsulfatase A-like enzyme
VIRGAARAAGVLLLAGFSGGVLACARAAAPAEIPERLAALGRPNLVLIVVDALRADFTTPYGSEQDSSPELAAWAGQGVLFERVRAQSSWTKMSVASLMTSLWPRTHGIRDARDGLAESAVTLADVFHAAGYATYAVQTNGWLHQSFGFHQGFDRYMFPNGGGDPRLGKPSLWPHADRVVEEAARLLDTHDRARPFFLYLHFMDVHEYAAPPQFKTFGTDDKGAYLAAIRWADDAIRRVREKLEAEGDLERTVIAFTADHGEAFGEQGVHGHARNVLTPVVSVPLVLRFPFRVEPAVRVASQVRNLDLAPTLLDLAQIPIPECFEGRSLVPLLTGRVSEPDRPSYAELGIPLFPDASVQAAVNDGTWTFARNAPAQEGDANGGRRFDPVGSGAEFLFDRRVDAGENVNLVAREPAEAARMRALLAEHLAGQPAAVVERGVRIDPEIAERLRAMGYLK